MVSLSYGENTGCWIISNMSWNIYKMPLILALQGTDIKKKILLSLGKDQSWDFSLSSESRKGSMALSLGANRIPRLEKQTRLWIDLDWASEIFCALYYFMLPLITAFSLLFSVWFNGKKIKHVHSNFLDDSSSGPLPLVLDLNFGLEDAGKVLYHWATYNLFLVSLDETVKRCNSLVFVIQIINFNIFLCYFPSFPFIYMILKLLFF